MPRAWALGASAWAIRPKPNNPRVLPLTEAKGRCCQCCGPSIHTCGSCLAAAKIVARANSARVAALVPRALATATLRNSHGGKKSRPEVTSCTNSRAKGQPAGGPAASSHSPWGAASSTRTSAGNGRGKPRGTSSTCIPGSHWRSCWLNAAPSWLATRLMPAPHGWARRTRRGPRRQGWRRFVGYECGCTARRGNAARSGCPAPAPGCRWLRCPTRRH